MRLFDLEPGTDWSYGGLVRRKRGDYDLEITVVPQYQAREGRHKNAGWRDIWPILMRSLGGFAQTRDEFSVHFLPHVVARVTALAIVIRVFWR